MGKASSPSASPRRASRRAGSSFTPVAVRARHDGWTPERQHGFIAALAESGCVLEACAAVGISPKSAYALRARPDASTFRQAWDVALDYAIRRLGDAALGRALHGVSRPIFYQGEQIGERRHYDERLTMFLLRYRDPVRYGAWLDGMEARRHPDGAAITLARALNNVLDAAHAVPHTDNQAAAVPGEEGRVDAIDAALGSSALEDGAHASADPDDAITDQSAFLRDLRHRVRALAAERFGPESDPAEEDWRSVTPVRRQRRPRRGSGADVV